MNTVILTSTRKYASNIKSLKSKYIPSSIICWVPCVKLSLSRIVRAISTFTCCSYLVLSCSRHDSLLKSHSKGSSGDSLGDSSRQALFCRNTPTKVSFSSLRMTRPDVWTQQNYIRGTQAQRVTSWLTVPGLRFFLGSFYYKQGL